MSVILTQAPSSGGYYAKNRVPPFVLEVTDMFVDIVVKHWPADDYNNFDWEDADTLFAGTYVPDFEGLVTVGLGDCYDAIVNTAIPDPDEDVYAQDAALRCVRAIVTDFEGTVVDDRYWFVANAKLPSDTAFEKWVTSHFLTNQPLEKRTTVEAKEWLSYFDLSVNVDCLLKARFYPKTGGSEEVTVHTDSENGCFSVDVSYQRIIAMADVLADTLLGYYDIILFDGGEHEMCRQRYILQSTAGNEKYYLFVNAVGGVDTMVCDGENLLQPDTTHNIGRFADRYRAIDDTDDRRVWQQNTGMVPHKHRNWIYELLTAKRDAARYVPATGLQHDIVVESSEIGMGDTGQLSSASFGYILANIDDTAIDIDGDDRTLHQSEADRAEDMDDLSTRIVAVFHSDGHGAYITDVVSVNATKLYVTADQHNIRDTVYYYLNGSHSASGSFTLDDAAHYVISKGADDTIYFTTRTDEVTALIINYYAQPWKKS